MHSFGDRKSKGGVQQGLVKQRERLVLSAVLHTHLLPYELMISDFQVKVCDLSVCFNQ